jgi:APA family basic amino acid/polyamine antiporter
MRLLQRIRLPSHILWRHPSFKKVLSVGALYSVGYGNVGSSIYYALGVTAFFALGATPITLAIAGIFFACTALTYAEGAGIIAGKGGGSATFARLAANELLSFFAGWMLMLDYIVTVAISAATVPYYLAFFFPGLKDPSSAYSIYIFDKLYVIPPYLLSTIIAFLLIISLVCLNVVGIKESARLNVFFCLIDLTVITLLCIVGFFLLFSPQKLLSYLDLSFSGSDTWPNLYFFFYSISIAMVAYVGIESVAQLSEEAKEPTKQIPRSLFLTVITVLVVYAAISTLALSAMHPQELKNNWADDPVAGIAFAIKEKSPLLGSIFSFLVAILAASILLMATNAGILGLSRLAFCMGEYRHLPKIMFKIHPRFSTPYSSIIIFSVIAMLLLLPGLYSPGLLRKLADVYSFGAMLAFSTAHLSILLLRLKKPELERPYTIPFNLKIKGRKLPLPAILGLISTLTVWFIVVFTHQWGRIIGFLWTAVGFSLYFIYRKVNKLSIFKEAKLELPLQPTFTPTKIKRILVPTIGSSSCEEMIEAACKLAHGEKSEVICLYVVEVPHGASLDDALSPSQESYIKRIEENSELIGKSYNVDIKLKVKKGRSSGKAIVEEAEQEKVDLILLGESEKLHPLSSGKTAQYIIEHAPCKVWGAIGSKKSVE